MTPVEGDSGTLSGSVVSSLCLGMTAMLTCGNRNSLRPALKAVGAKFGDNAENKAGEIFAHGVDVLEEIVSQWDQRNVLTCTPDLTQERSEMASQKRLLTYDQKKSWEGL